ncbi:MAG: hypothetical protein EBU46_21640 [Nitrosomonadaceae bacterium]|nr:hypothetical protein [Nitrosomonadaceae bacterium]
MAPAVPLLPATVRAVFVPSASAGATVSLPATLTPELAAPSHARYAVLAALPMTTWSLALLSGSAAPAPTNTLRLPWIVVIIFCFYFSARATQRLPLRPMHAITTAPQAEALRRVDLQKKLRAAGLTAPQSHSAMRHIAELGWSKCVSKALLARLALARPRAPAG